MHPKSLSSSFSVFLLPGFCFLGPQCTATKALPQGDADQTESSSPSSQLTANWPMVTTHWPINWPDEFAELEIGMEGKYRSQLKIKVSGTGEIAQQ